MLILVQSNITANRSDDVDVVYTNAYVLIIIEKIGNLYMTPYLDGDLRVRHSSL